MIYLPHAAVVLLLTSLAVALPAAEPLPMPSAASLPPDPAPLPAVVTAGGQRRLLADTDVVVAWDAAAGVPVSNRPGWWVVNAPFSAVRRPDGMSPDALAQAATGLPAAQIRAWWLYTPGAPAVEPLPARGPAPLAPMPAEQVVVVDQAHPEADDANPGTAARPMRTVRAAAGRLGPGVKVLVRYGIYREAVTVRQGGSATAPAVIEGLRDAEGRMPVLSANAVVPAAAWTAEPGGLYRAPLPVPAYGAVSCDGVLLAERDRLAGLADGEVVVSRSSREFVQPRLDPAAIPAEGQTLDGSAWRRIEAGSDGAFVLPDGPAVWYLASWVWVRPGARRQGEVFDPACPRPIGGDLVLGGFRTFRQAGSRPENQINQARVWIGGTALPCVPRPGAPCAYAGWGDSGDVIKGVRLAEGWNRVLLQLDTTTRPRAPRLQLTMPPAVGAVVSRAAPPGDPGLAPAASASSPRLTEALLLGPFPAVNEQALYVRLPGGRDPRIAGPVVDTAAIGTALAVDAPFVLVRGLEIRHGGQFSQRALVHLNGVGGLLEGCLVREAEWNAVNVGLGGGSQADPPTVVRGCWMVAPGGLGLGCGGEAASFAPAEVDRAPDRRRLVAEWNRITDNNRLGHDRWWESGAMKICRNVGAVIRCNDLLGGDGPGLWFDWENYGIRVTGNFASAVTGCMVGIEASPGPVVVGANIAHDTRPGGAWFKYALLAWSSAQVWAVNNTIDGAWNQQDAHWHGQKGADGIYLDEGGDDRATLWGALPTRRQAVLNNLVVGCAGGVHSPRPGSLLAANPHDRRPDGAAIRFRAPAARDYRLLSGAANADLPPGRGDAPESAQVRYDFYGLPFANGVGRPPGACRIDPPVPAGCRAVIEIETIDGRFLRREL